MLYISCHFIPLKLLTLRMDHAKLLDVLTLWPSADPEGGQGARPPPGKSQVIWVSIGNKQLDPPPPLEKVGPPPLENIGPPLEP